MGRRILIGGAVSVLVLGLAIVSALYVWGPRYGASIVGRPIFVVPPSPERYAGAVLDIAQQRGLHASSPEFAHARTVAMAAAEQADDVSDIHDELDEALRAAGGKHSRMITPGQRQDDLAGPVERPDVTLEGRVVPATVPAHHAEKDAQAYADTLAHGLGDAIYDGACGVVVDLRGNGGGDMGPMVAGLSTLLPDGPAMHFVTGHDERPVTIDGNGVRGGGSPVGVEGVRKHRLPVAVLVDGATVSSGEMTMLAFRGVGDTRSFGAPTAGNTTANTVVDMPDGAQMVLTVAKVRDRIGQLFDDTSIQPDEPTTGDAAVAAERWLATRHDCA